MRLSPEVHEEIDKCKDRFYRMHYNKTITDLKVKRINDEYCSRCDRYQVTAKVNGVPVKQIIPREFVAKDALEAISISSDEDVSSDDNSLDELVRTVQRNQQIAAEEATKKTRTCQQSFIAYYFPLATQNVTVRTTRSCITVTGQVDGIKKVRRFNPDSCQLLPDDIPLAKCIGCGALGTLGSLCTQDQCEDSGNICVD